MSSLPTKKIILGVTGSVAAYKAAEITRLFLKQDVAVRVIMTQAAQQFITPLTFQALLNNQQVFTDLFTPLHSAMEHIELARWADAILIAPASASCIARLAHGLADDLLSATCLAAERPLFIAPAMNQKMWQHAITQQNVKTLQQHAAHILGPDQGEQACGDVGLGRMLAPEEIVSQVLGQLSGKLAGLRVVITAGPTREAIDAVRFISNHSSGKMGYALAHALHQQGAQVTLISGPCTLMPPAVLHFIPVTSAQEMATTVMEAVTDCDIFIAAAAVADFRPAHFHAGKIKKKNADWQLKLTPNSDILHTVAALPNPPYTVGFALEANNLLANARQKLIHKNVDMIIANELGDSSPFYADENEVWVLQQHAEPLHIPRTPKMTLAKKLTEIIFTAFIEKNNQVCKA